MSAREDIAYLVGSESRTAILRELAVAGFRPTDLADRCSCARETAQRTLAGFAERGWVEKRERRYHLTPAGEMVLERYEDLQHTVETASRLEPFLVHARELASDLPPSMYDDLTVTTATTENPHAPINRLLAVFGDEHADQFYGVSPIVSGVFNRAAEAVIGPETAVELVIDQSVLEASQESYPDALKLAFDLSQLQLYLSPEQLDSGLVVIDGRAFLGAYDEMGNLVAGVDGGAQPFVGWVTDRFLEYRDRSQPMRPPTEGADDRSVSERSSTE